jgi:membrane protease YdiL (CAAX protease family)
MTDRELAPAPIAGSAAEAGPRTRAWPRAAFRRLVGSPAYPAEAADRREFEILGLRLPVRATVVITVVVLAMIFDYSRTFFPRDLIAFDRNPGMQRLQAVDRLALYVLVPLLVTIIGFRDRPSRYGLRLGDWRWGIGLAVAGCAVMTPIVLAVAPDPSFHEFYGPSWSSLPDVLATNGIDLFSAEFMFRGFLMLTLVRTIGPIGVLVAALPFVFGHLTKPEIELLSALAGGMAYGWLTWRTGSILWGALAHTYILTLLMWAAAAAPNAAG